MVAKAPGVTPHYATNILQGAFCAVMGQQRRLQIRLFCTGEPQLNHTFDVRETAQLGGGWDEGRILHTLFLSA